MTAAARRRPPAAPRNAGIVVFRLLWSMSYDRNVRIVLRDGAGVRVAKVKRTWLDPRRRPRDAKSQSSPVVAVLHTGEEVAVNSIERVQLPHGDEGNVFMEGQR